MEKVNEIIEKISQLSILHIVLISILFVGLYYVFILQYDDSLYVAEQSINMTKENIEQKDKEFGSLKALIESSTNLQDEYIEKTKSFNVFAQYMKRVENSTTFFSQMTNSFITAIGIQVNNYESQEAVIVRNTLDQSIDNYKLMPLEISIAGTFAQLLSFMSYLTQSEQLIAIESFKMEKIEPAHAKGQLSLLSLTGRIILYSLLSEEDKLETQKETEGNNKDDTTSNTGSASTSPGAN